MPYTADILAAIDAFDLDRLQPLLAPQTEHERTEQTRQITVALGWFEREMKVRLRAENDMWRDSDTIWNTFMNHLRIAADQGVPLENITGPLKEHFNTTDQDQLLTSYRTPESTSPPQSPPLSQLLQVAAGCYSAVY